MSDCQETEHITPFAQISYVALKLENESLYLLKAGPLTTTEIHSKVQKIHPDLCDDKIDHIIIYGVNFGKKWKHDVRNAQQSLKKEAIVRNEGNLWQLNMERLG